jgi:hypothetical protein
VERWSGEMHNPCSRIQRLVSDRRKS